MADQTRKYLQYPSSELASVHVKHRDDRIVHLVVFIVKRHRRGRRNGRRFDLILPARMAFVKLIFFRKAENSAMRETRSNTNAKRLLIPVTERSLPREYETNFYVIRDVPETCSMIVLLLTNVF